MKLRAASEMEAQALLDDVVAVTAAMDDAHGIGLNDSKTQR